MTLSLCCVTWGGLILTSYNRFLLDTDQVPTTHSLQLGLSTPETSGSRTPAGGTAGVIQHQVGASSAVPLIFIGTFNSVGIRKSEVDDDHTWQ